MTDTKWYAIEDLYTIEKYKIKHNKNPKTKWIRLPCVYKIKINETVVEIGRSDTCKKHGGAEKVDVAAQRTTTSRPKGSAQKVLLLKQP
mgnify:CR=1 FL=1